MFVGLVYGARIRIVVHDGGHVEFFGEVEMPASRVIFVEVGVALDEGQSLWQVGFGEFGMVASVTDQHIER